MTDAGKFKVGDRVRTSGWGDRTFEEVPDDMTGTVVGVHEDLPYPFTVKLDLPAWTSGQPLLCYHDEIEPLDGKEEGNE